MSSSDGDSGRHVVLIGLSGAGKSTVARALATLLGWPCTDMDVLIAERAGVSVPMLLRQDPVRFRLIEEEVIADVLANPTPHVVATGGGAVTTLATRERLSGGRGVQPRPAVVWLRAPTAILAGRLEGSEDRPLLAGVDVMGRLEALSRERDALYASVATLTLDTTTATPDEGAEDIRAWLLALPGK